MGYDFDVEYRLGKANCVADCLSRNPLPDTLPISKDSDLDDTKIFLTIDDLKQQQRNDDFCKTMITMIETGKARECFQLKDGIAVKRVMTEIGPKILTLLPLSLLNEILHELHDKSGH